MDVGDDQVAHVSRPASRQRGTEKFRDARATSSTVISPFTKTARSAFYRKGAAPRTDAALFDVRKSGRSVSSRETVGQD